MWNKLARAAVLVMICLLVAGTAATPAPLEIFEAAGILESLEETKDGWEITLKVNGADASALVADACCYYLDHGQGGQEVSREVFIDQAIGQWSIVEFHGQDQEVSLCRARIIRHN